MRNDELVIAIALVFAVIVLIAVKIIEFFVRFNNDTRYITREMQRADDYNTYRRWRGELRCHYLCLIPFVNERNVMWLYRRIYHKPKHENKEKRSDGLYHILAPSVIGIFICTVCLCSASWAWFTSTQSNNIETVTTATYTAEVTAKKVVESGKETDENIDVIITNDNNSKTPTSKIKIKAACKYEITVSAKGNAKTGYCKINFNETKIDYTSQISPNGTLTFYVLSDKEGDLFITPEWGTCSCTATVTNNILVNLSAGKK